MKSILFFLELIQNEFRSVLCVRKLSSSKYIQGIKILKIFRLIFKNNCFERHWFKNVFQKWQLRAKNIDGCSRYTPSLKMFKTTFCKLLDLSDTKGKIPMLIIHVKV